MPFEHSMELNSDEKSTNICVRRIYIVPKYTHTRFSLVSSVIIIAVCFHGCADWLKSDKWNQWNIDTTQYALVIHMTFTLIVNSDILFMHGILAYIAKSHTFAYVSHIVGGFIFSCSSDFKSIFAPLIHFCQSMFLRWKSKFNVLLVAVVFILCAATYHQLSHRFKQTDIWHYFHYTKINIHSENIQHSSSQQKQKATFQTIIFDAMYAGCFCVYKNALRFICSLALDVFSFRLRVLNICEW